MKRALSILTAVFAYVAVPLLLSGNDYVMSLLIAALTVAGIALPWALLGNLGGMVSFGHAVFFGVGSYTSVLLVRAWGIDPFVGILFGGIGAAIAAIATMPALKLRGPYFALAILAYAEIFRILANQATWLTGGAAGILRIPQFTPWFGIPFNTKPGAYVVILTLVLISMAIYHRIRSSAWGLALKAMGGTEDATRVIGVPSTYLKAAMLAVSAALTGMVGAYNAHVIGFLEPDYAFGAVWSVAPIVAAIFGGYRTVSGPVIGALAVYLLDQLLFKSLLPTGHLVMYGVLLVVVILASPTGLLPAVMRLVKGKSHAAS